jgi:hypothetical protein
VEYSISDIANTLGDDKNGKLAAETLMSLAEATKLELVATEVMNFAFAQEARYGKKHLFGFPQP